MRGKPQAQPDFLTVINLNASVPADHPLRAIKRQLDVVLKKLSPLFDDLYEELGRPSIPPEQLLKARVLTALYTVRRSASSANSSATIWLWLWFLDREFSEGQFQSRLRQRTTSASYSADVAKLFFAEVYALSGVRKAGPVTKHFTADGLPQPDRVGEELRHKDGADAASSPPG